MSLACRWLPAAGPLHGNRCRYRLPRRTAGTYVEKVIVARDLTITGAGTFLTVVADNAAGVVISSGATARLLDCAVNGNRATTTFGGIANLTRSLTVDGRTISANGAEYGGV